MRVYKAKSVLLHEGATARDVYIARSAVKLFWSRSGRTHVLYEGSEYVIDQPAKDVAEDITYGR